VERNITPFSKTAFTRRATLKGLGAASLAVLGARASLALTAAQDATPATGDYPTVAFTAKDYQFLGLPASIPGGLTRLSMTQEGPADHHAMFMRLNDGVTPDDFMAALQSGDFGALLGAAVSLGGPNAGAIGTTTNVVVDLTPGQYMVVCLVPDEETGMPHAAMGMLAPLEVTEAGATAQPPESDLTVDLVDFAFEGLSSEIAAGGHTWTVMDTGEQVHEMVIYKMAEGVPYSVAESIFLAPPAASPEASPEGMEEMPEDMEMASPAAESSPMAGGPPPFSAYGGIAPMSPGVTNYLELDLTAGEYFAICFVPDFASGAPHFALGMIMPFTVA
jgi:hypothetical protein